MKTNRPMRKYIEENFNSMKIEIINLDDYRLEYKCLICGAIKSATLTAIKKSLEKSNILHSESCSRYFNNIIKKQLDIKKLNQFRGFYRYAKERCNNPNNKDYERYKGKFLFKDYPHYFNCCYEHYKQSLLKYNDESLSIDRIDNSKGYEPNNIRFIPMRTNLQNKDCIFPVMAVNIKTKEILEASSVNELAELYFDKKTNSIWESIKYNRLYLKTWKIFYTIET